MSKVKIVKTDNSSEPWSVVLPSGVVYDTHDIYEDALQCAMECMKDI